MLLTCRAIKSTATVTPTRKVMKGNSSNVKEKISRGTTSQDRDDVDLVKIASNMNLAKSSVRRLRGDKAAEKQK